MELWFNPAYFTGAKALIYKGDTGARASASSGTTTVWRCWAAG
jgi:hypothetical protein